MESERSKMISGSNLDSYVNSGTINHDIISNYCLFTSNFKGLDGHRNFLSPLINLK